LILSTLENCGVTKESKLTGVVAKQLGFQRTGAKIRARIEGCFNDLLTEKKVVRTDENGLKPNSNSIVPGTPYLTLDAVVPGTRSSSGDTIPNS
jgi:hypothetical protein